MSFALLGKAVFVFLGITVADFQIAGGLILLALAGLDLLGSAPRGLVEGTDIGIVPLAVPMITRGHHQRDRDAKIISLLLAAIGVHLIRQGLAG